jgi:hypothetical protein
VRRDILTKRAEQILEQRHGEVARPNRLTQGEKNLIGRIALPDSDTRVQPTLPIVQQMKPLGGRAPAFVGKIVGRAGKRVQRRHVRPHTGRQEARGHGKIFVMVSRQPLARRVGGAQLCVELQARYFTGDPPCAT